MPTVPVALQRFERELASARERKVALLKVIHGYGSSGVGGDIRIAVQKRLFELTEAGRVRACVYGENWSRSDDATWKLLQEFPELKKDCDLERGNRGITVVVL